jgi:hypothetical protein
MGPSMTIVSVMTTKGLFLFTIIDIDFYPVPLALDSYAG